MKSQRVVRALTVGNEVLPVQFRKFSHHFTVTAPDLPRLKVKLDSSGRFVCTAKGTKGKTDGSRPDKAFARGVRHFWK